MEGASSARYRRPNTEIGLVSMSLTQWWAQDGPIGLRSWRCESQASHPTPYLPARSSTRLLSGYYLFAFETTHPDELGASSVDPSDLYGNPLLFMKRANALLKDLEPGVHHAPVDSVYL